MSEVSTAQVRAVKNGLFEQGIAQVRARQICAPQVDPVEPTTAQIVSRQ